MDLVEIEYADASGSWQNNTFPYGSSQNFSNGTTPNSRRTNGSYSNVAISNIHVINLTYGVVDILDDAPLAPTLTMSGNWGENPTLSWTNSGETDINHYVLKKYYVFDAGGSSTMYVNPASTPHTDYNVTRDKYGDLVAYYTVKAVDNVGNESVYSNQVSTDGQSNWKNSPSNYTNSEIDEYSLKNNYPNPFNPSTKISYSMKEEGLVTLKVYDILGNEVVTLVNEKKPEGFYDVEFNAVDLPSGIYFYKMQAGKFIAVNKMILLR
jgi:hypothetical protein